MTCVEIKQLRGKELKIEPQSCRQVAGIFVCQEVKNIHEGLFGNMRSVFSWISRDHKNFCKTDVGGSNCSFNPEEKVF
jgi:hypothetical protein